MALVCRYCGGGNVQFTRPIADFKSAQISVVCMDCGAEF
jgi:hypothetical protein